MKGLILYGAPATGKDTITDVLTGGGGFSRFRRLKCGAGRQMGYRMVNAGQLLTVQAAPEEVVWVNHRYGATYVIDRSGLVDALNGTEIPVLHIGQPEAITAVQRSTRAEWYVVELICDRETAEQRIVGRSTGDTAERLAAFDETPRLISASLVLDTSTLRPAAAARKIRDLVM